MPRYKLTIEYDGQFFSGWQYQPTPITTVQGRLERAIKQLTGVFVPIFGAGRTDKGVHAVGQVAHADFPRFYEPDVICRALNFYLKPDPVAVIRVESVDSAFHARFSARARIYRYCIINRCAPSVLERFRAWWVPQTLDVERMQAGCRVLVGEHDFSSFRDRDCQATSPIRTISAFCILTVGEMIHFNIQAPSFLHKQVRIMVGTLKQVGQGFWTVGDLEEIVHKKDRQVAGQTAPAHGLTLMDVVYNGS